MTLESEWVWGWLRCDVPSQRWAVRKGGKPMTLDSEWVWSGCGGGCDAMCHLNIGRCEREEWVWGGCGGGCDAMCRLNIGQ
jgi:hypothetical protein